MRVLIVDNKQRARQSMNALLRAWYPAAQLHEAANGMEAVTLAEEYQPDLVLMDVRMPKMDGLEACRVIKAAQPKIKIIILSMYPEYEAEALASGAEAFVSKSDPPDRLRKMLADVLPRI